MGWPQYILLALFASNIAQNITKDGKPRQEPYSWRVSVISTTIAMVLLSWGGFFGR